MGHHTRRGKRVAGEKHVIPHVNRLVRCGELHRTVRFPGSFLELHESEVLRQRTLIRLCRIDTTVPLIFSPDGSSTCKSW